jgi:long-chain acyl-CoA synthetase
MNSLAVLFEKFKQNPDLEALVWKDVGYSYGWLAKRGQELEVLLNNSGVTPGSVVELNTDFSPETVALLLALINRSCIVAPTSKIPFAKREEFRQIAQVEWIITVDSDDSFSLDRASALADNDHILTLRNRQVPGLIIFSSGSSGKSKAGVHDFARLLEKFATPRKTMRVLAFLLFDHIGGIKTLFYTRFNLGTIIVPKDRSPVNVCAAIEIHRATALTTTPTFLQLMLLSARARLHDLSSLRIINYGSEVMPESTLSRMHELYPAVRLSQGYGLSEVGVIPTESESSSSLLMKLKIQDGFEYRIREGLLEIKSRSAILGYLNAPSPFTDDGWFKTGDVVEQHGDYVRILGRASELINVG